MLKKDSHKQNEPQAEDILHQEVSRRKPPRQSTGSGIPSFWLKTAAVICGTLVIGVVGPNWDSISGRFNSPEVSPESLLDPVDAPMIILGGTQARPVEPSDFWIHDAPNETTQDLPVPEEEAPLNLTKIFTSTEYQVKQGDSVFRIAAEFSVSMGSIIALNGMKDASVLPVGKMIKVPNMDGLPYTVKKNDTIINIARKEKIPENAILDANDLSSDTIYVGQVLFLPGARMNTAEFQAAVDPRMRKPMTNPILGRIYITSNYGWRLDPVKPRSGVRRFHEGIDLRGAWGTSVKAAMDGFVEEKGYDRILGNFVILNHGNYSTLYAHLSSSSAKKGARIKQGQEIGKVGDTGYTTGAHLHFAVYDRKGNSVNPNGLLR